MSQSKPPSDAAARYNLNISAQRLEAARKRNPSSQRPSPAKRINPNSPEGRAIAQRFAKQKPDPET
jgi:hypothetical protein